MFEWSPLQCDVNRNNLPGDSLKSNCSGKMVKQVASATDVEPFPDSSLPEDDRLGTRFPEIELNKRSYSAVIVRTENKDPSSLFSTFIRFILFVQIFQSSKFERVRKGANTKTR